MAVALPTCVTKGSLAGLDYDADNVMLDEVFLFTNAIGDGFFHLADGDVAAINTDPIAGVESRGPDVIVQRRKGHPG